MKRVLLISSGKLDAPHLDVLRRFAATLNEHDPTVQFASCAVQHLVFSVDDDQSVHVRLDGIELHESYDVLHLRNINFFTDYASALRLYAEVHGMRIVNRADAQLPYYGKVSQGFLMALQGIPTPHLISSPSNETLTAAISQMSFPAVIKHNDGIKGRDNYLAHSYDDARQILAQDKHGFVAQSFIDNAGELRVLTFGVGRDPLVFKKKASEGSHLNNTSQGGAAELIAAGNIEPRMLAQACKAAEIMGRDIAGVDVLLANDGSFYVLEVNITPALASGVFISEKIAQYIAFFKEEKTI